MYKTQQRYSMLQLAQFKTSTTGNSAMSAAYSKNIPTVSFFVWKRSEFRDTTVRFWTVLSFGSTGRFFQSDSIYTHAFDPFGNGGKWQDSHFIRLKQKEFHFKFGFGFTTEKLKRKTFETEGDIQKCWCDALLLIASLLGGGVQKTCFGDSVKAWRLEGR